MSVLLDEEGLRVTAFYDRSAARGENICLYLEETCPGALKLLQGGEAAVHLTPGQARAIADELLAAVMEEKRKK